jgi:sulfide:quinone oxidoreductase
MIHVCPPQTAPDFVRVSPLADEAGWLSVDQNTLRHPEYENIYGLGDVVNAPNAKTAAAARKQAPVVAQNILHDIRSGANVAHHDGYGGRLLPSFPSWLVDGTRPSRMAWLLKEEILPPLYWKGMLKGREWLAQPESVG